MSETEKTSAKAAPGFREDLTQLWAQWPDKPLFFALLAAWFALFHFLGNSTFGYIDTSSLFAWLRAAYNSQFSDDSHGNIIPFVVLALFWHKRAELLAVEKTVWWPASLMVFFGVALHLVGYLVQQPRLSFVALLLGVYGSVGLLWGWRLLRAGFFPYFLLVFCIPFGALADTVTLPLRLLTAQVSVGISHDILGMDVVRDGSRIYDSLRTFNYDVAPACSGIRSLISLLALTTIFGFVTFQSTWKRLLMVVISVPLAILGNVIRLLTVILVADAFGQEKGQLIEQKLGFVTFAVAIVCVLILGHFLQEKPLPVRADGESEAP